MKYKILDQKDSIWYYLNGGNPTGYIPATAIRRISHFPKFHVSTVNKEEVYGLLLNLKYCKLRTRYAFFPGSCFFTKVRIAHYICIHLKLYLHKGI